MARRVACRSVVLCGLAALLAGCGGSSAKAGPAPTTRPTTAPQYSDSAVLGWVTTTLDNGASLFTTQPAGASDAQLLPAAQQLGVACSVSRQELGQTTWLGNRDRDETRLKDNLSKIEALIGAHPAGFGTQLTTDLRAMSADLAALNKDVSA